MTMTLPVSARDASASRSALPEGHMPAVVYGPQQEALAISVDAHVFDKARREAGESTIITLTGLSEEIEVLIKQVDFDPTKAAITHADLYAIERGKEMTATVPFEFIGEAPAEKAGGTVTRAMQDIEVTCRPSNLPAHIDVDIAVLADEDSKITVADLPVLEGVTYNAEVEDAVAVVTVQKEESDADAGDVDMGAVAIEEKGKETAAE